MKDFFCKTYGNDESKIFKLIEKEDKDLKALNKEFDNLEVKVLSDALSELCMKSNQEESQDIS